MNATRLGRTRGAWAVAATLSACIAATCAQDVPVVWTGGNSRVAKHETLLIDNAWDWTRVWMRNLGKEKEFGQLEAWAGEGRFPRGYGYYNEYAVPEVDFGRHVVVALFDPPTQEAGFSLMSCALEGEAPSDPSASLEGKVRVLRYLPRFYSIGANTPQEARALQSRPFGFFLIPRDFDVLRVEEGVIERKGDPPKKFRLRMELRLGASKPPSA
jgi:hypothetical protein